MQGWRRTELGQQLALGVYLFDRVRMRIEFGEIGRQVTLQGDEAAKISRGKYVALHLTQDNLDLIQPAGVLGQPVNADFKGQLQRGQPWNRTQILQTTVPMIRVFQFVRSMVG